MRPPPNAPAAGRVLGLFAKYPEPGQVKTRLAAGTSPAWASRVADALLRDSIDRLAAIDARRFLVFAPAAAHTFFADLVRERFALVPQCEGHLGRRLAAFVSARREAGASAVVLVGTDSPTLPLALVEQAFRELEQADVVLGPALDGGYYLVGCACRGALPPIFEGIAWSSRRVLADTVARLAEPRWRLALLPPWYDVDTVEDWWLLCGHLAALRRAGQDPAAPRTEQLTQVPLP